VNGLGIRRCVLWNDANGSSFVLSALSKLDGRPIVVEDCDVIYSRAKWHHWSGGRVFNMRGEGAGSAGAGVIFRNLTFENLTLGGKPVRDAEFFQTNEFVDGLIFRRQKDVR